MSIVPTKGVTSMERKNYNEIEELRDVLENKEFAPEEEIELREYLSILESRLPREDGSKRIEKLIDADAEVRIKRRLDKKYKSRERAKTKKENEGPNLENKRLANKIVRQHSEFNASGSSYKKLYGEDEEAEN